MSRGTTVNRAAVVRMSKQGMTASQIADQLDCGTGAIYRHLQLFRLEEKARVRESKKLANGNGNGHKKISGHALTVEVTRHDNGKIMDFPVGQLHELTERVTNVAKSLLPALEEQKRRLEVKISAIKELIN